MSEKRFLNLICLEGLFLIVLGLCVLILPKLTTMTFGVILSSVFIAYGLYKIILSFVNRNYLLNFFWSIFLGVFILTIGILLLFVPKISLLWLIALIGVFFILDSISLTSFMARISSMFNYVGCKGMTAFFIFLIGLSILIGLPLMSFWVVALLSGVAFLIKGMSKMTLALININNYNV